MKFTRNRFAALAAALVLVIAGCAKQSEQTSETVTPSPTPMTTERLAYAGTLNGTNATIVFDPASNEYILIENAGAPTAKRITGRWTITQGTGAEANAQVYELTPASGGAPMRFVVSNDTEIRLTGDANAPTVTFTKTTVPDMPATAVQLTPADAGTTVRLSPGEEVVLMMPVSAAGEQWTMDASSTAPLMRVDAASTPSTATDQAITFKATQAGNGTLKLKAPAGSTATPKEFMVTIVVE